LPGNRGVARRVRRRLLRPIVPLRAVRDGRGEILGVFDHGLVVDMLAIGSQREPLDEVLRRRGRARSFTNYPLPPSRPVCGVAGTPVQQSVDHAGTLRVEMEAAWNDEVTANSGIGPHHVYGRIVAGIRAAVDGDRVD
jgi:hypothetical protein